METKIEKSQSRSKYAGWPGSITALRVDYSGRSAAFGALDRTEDPDMTTRKEELKNWKTGFKMDNLPPWEQSVATKNMKFPDRAKMRLLSTNQAVKIEHNFRAQQLPSCYKDTVFVSTRGKSQGNEVKFLTAREQEKMIDTNIGTHLSRSEYNDPEQYVGEKQWNMSVELDKSRSDINRQKQYPDFRAINKTRKAPKNYVSPETTVRRSLHQRERDRLAVKEAAAQEVAALHRRPLTMSNKHEWLPQVSEQPSEPSRPPSQGSARGSQDYD